MKRTITTLLAAVATAAASAQERLSIALFDVSPTPAIQTKVNGEPGNQALGLATITDSIRASMPTIMNQTNKFDVQAFGDTKGMIEENNINIEANANPSDPRVAQLFSANGISHSIVVKIDFYNDTGTVTVNTAARRDIQLTAVAEIYDNETQRLVTGLPFRPESKQMTCRNCVTQAGGLPLGGELLIEFGDDIAKGLAALVIEHFYPIQVIRVSRGQLTVNIGSAGGFEVGDVFDIVEREAFEDPQTGSIIFDEFPIGKARIARVSTTSARADLIEGDLDDIDAIVQEGDPAYTVVLRRPQG